VLYVNGTAGTAKTYSSVSTAPAVRARARRYHGSRVDYFIGRIDEVKVWNSTLTSAQVAAIG